MGRHHSGRRLTAVLWAAGLLGYVGLALADVWDPTDHALFSGNELVHGSDQMHELGPGGVDDPGGRDVDYFQIAERALASYEVVVDGVSHDIASDLVLQRLGAAGVQESLPITAAGRSRSLRWENTANSNLPSSFVRVGSTHPCFSCTSAKAGYHIRSYETTYRIPRFNNVGTQSTVLLVQNAAAHTVTGHAHFWSASGALLGSVPFQLGPKRMLVQDTASLGFAAGASGSITVSHDGRYGDLAGKAVALEPATGFTFDTPLTPVPR